MASFSQGFLSNLGRPAMTQSMFDLGSTLGKMPQQRRDKQKREGAEALMAEGQKAMSENNTAKLNAVAQKLTQLGFPKEGMQLSQAAEASRKRGVRIGAGKNMASGLPSDIKKAAQAFMEEGDIEAGTAAMDLAKTRRIEKGVASLQKYAGSAKINLEDPKAREGFFRIASAYEIPAEIAQDMFDEVSGTDNMTFGTEYRVRDEKGNYFSVRHGYNKETGKQKRITTPFAGSPESPVGKTVPVSTTTGTSGFDRPEIEGDTTINKEFGKLKIEAVNSLPDLMYSKRTTEKAIAALEEIRTGGFTTKIIDNAQEFLGVQPKNRADFAYLSGKAVLDGLKNFTGAISEGERKYLEDLLFSLERSGGANEAILEEILAHAEWSLNDAILKSEAKNYKEYAKNYTPRRKQLSADDLDQKPKAKQEENQTPDVSWADL